MRILTVLLLAITTLPAFAQAPPAQDDADAPRNYPMNRLKAETKPLRAASLEELAELWMGHLEQAVAAESQLILDDDATGEQLATAETRRNAVIARLEAVVDSYEGKGGDAAKVSEYRSYINQTGGTSVDWFDPKAASGYFSAWLVSPEGGIAVGLNIAKFVVVLLLSWIVSRIAGMVVLSAVKRLPTASTLLRNFAVKIVRRVVLIIGFVVALSVLGVNINPLVAAIGAAGLVIGLALQGTLSNFASGILILVYRPFDVGDGISAGGITGKVEAMSLVQTTILTFDNQIQFVPNNEIWNSVITNMTGRDTRRVDMTFGIGYTDDIAKAERIIGEIVGAHGKVLADPAPVIKLHELADSSVNFIVRPWSLTADYWDVYWDVTKAIKERFDAAEIGIPFPQQDMHFPEPVRVVVSQS